MAGQGDQRHPRDCPGRWREWARRYLDPHLADQILLPLALTGGLSRFRTSKVTRHLLTHRVVIKNFCPISIEIQGELEKPGIVLVQGKGL